MFQIILKFLLSITSSTTSRERSKGKGQGKGRAPGAVKYQHDMLINIVEKYLPNGALGWQKVCQEYHERSGEKVLHNFNQVRKNWQNSQSFCNGKKKPTGQKGEKGDHTH